MVRIQERLTILEARQYTHTDIAGIGRAIQQHRPADASRLGINRVSTDIRPDLRARLCPLIEQMKQATSKKQLQKPVYAAVKLLADCNQNRLRVLDTSDSGYGGIRIQKPNISLSLSAEKLIAQLVAVIELRVELVSKPKQHEVLGQIRERLSYILQQQPGRQTALGLGMSSRQLVVVKCDAQGLVDYTSFISIDWLNSADDGWQVLLGFLSMRPHQYGYVDPTVPVSFTLPGGVALEEFTAVVTRKNVAVYKAAARIRGERENIVLKIGAKSSISKEARLLELPAVKNCKYLPTLVATGNLAPIMQGGFDQYLLIKEYGVHITSAAAPAAIIKYIRDAASGLSTLASAGYLHCDISPDNLVVVWDRAADSVFDQLSASMHIDAGDSQQDSSSIEAGTSDLGSSEQYSETDSIEAAMETDSDGLKCIVLDLHVAKSGNAASSPSTLTSSSSSGSTPATSGKPLFFGLGVHMTGRHSLSADLESLFLCALDIVSDGAAIRWRNAHFSPDHDEMFDIKCSSLLVDFTWQTKMLPRCILDELKEWLNQLRQLFYPSAAAVAGRPIVCRGHNDTVTPEEFISLCEQAHKRLSPRMQEGEQSQHGGSGV